MAFPASTTPVYRKRQKQGDFVIFGPAHLIVEGLVTVTLKSGATKQEVIKGLGAIFQLEDGSDARYGYLTESDPTFTATPSNNTPNKLTSPATADIEPEFVMPSAPVSLDADDFLPDDGTDGGGEYYEADEAA